MIERISTDLPVPEPPTTPRISPRLTLSDEVLVDHLLAEAVAQALDHDRELAVEVLGDVVARLVEPPRGFRLVVFAHPQPISVKNTAKNASSTITMKIAWTTAMVVRRPTSSELPSTCMPW